MGRGDRPIKKEQIALFEDILKSDKEDRQTPWLSNKIVDVPLNDQVLKQVTRKIMKFI